MFGLFLILRQKKTITSHLKAAIKQYKLLTTETKTGKYLNLYFPLFSFLF